MALVAKFGRPDYFITVTANQSWAAVKANLRPGEMPYNRPDLIARVFRMKLKELMREITHGVDGSPPVFGRPTAHTHVIEFQKRGLPHAHILVILEKSSKPKSAADIDRFVSAELPMGDDEDSKQLRDIIERCMLHGPCGTLNPNCVCMVAGSCSKNFPKEFQQETSWCDSGYPKYRFQV
jgi:hypothetical protein